MAQYVDALFGGACEEHCSLRTLPMRLKLASIEQLRNQKFDLGFTYHL